MMYCKSKNISALFRIVSYHFISSKKRRNISFKDTSAVKNTWYAFPLMSKNQKRTDTHLFAERRDALILGTLKALELEAVAAVELVVALLPPAEASRERARPARRTFGGELPVQMQHREFGGATCHRAAGTPHAALDSLDTALGLRLVAAGLRAAAVAVGARAARSARFDRMRARLRLLATLALTRRLAAGCVGAV